MSVKRLKTVFDTILTELFLYCVPTTGGQDSTNDTQGAPVGLGLTLGYWVPVVERTDRGKLLPSRRQISVPTAGPEGHNHTSDVSVGRRDPVVGPWDQRSTPVLEGEVGLWVTLVVEVICIVTIKSSVCLW